jgi:DNA-binding PadR family transcriptional regulator
MALHKQLMLLGLLQRGPLHGYELHRIVQAHGELYTDLKKANVYYLLDRLAQDGCVEVHAEVGTRGARGERLVYTLTDQGRARFGVLLRDVLRDFEPAHTGLDVAVVFLNRLPPAEAVALLEERHVTITTRRQRSAVELGDVAARGLPGALAADHLLSLIDAELAWLERALVRLREADWVGSGPAPTGPDAEQHASGA